MLMAASRGKHDVSTGFPNGEDAKAGKKMGDLSKVDVREDCSGTPRRSTV